MTRDFRFLASFVVNLVLAVALLIVLLRESERAPDRPPVEASLVTATDAKPAVQKQPKTHPFPANASVADQRRWLVEEMRAAGLPNRTIARVIRSDLDESWDKRFEQFRGD